MAQMGWVQKFRHMRRQAKSEAWGRMCARVMAFGFQMNKQKYRGVAPTYAWLARKTLVQRNHWQQLSETELIFDKNGIRITIPDDATGLQVILDVIAVEYGNTLVDLPAGDQAAYVYYAQHEAERYVLGEGNPYPVTDSPDKVG